MENPWIIHVKKVAKEQGISYREALKVAGQTYEKKMGMKGGEVKPFLMEGEGAIWDAVLKAVSKTKKLMENIDIVQDIVDLVAKVLDKNASTDEKIGEGKKVFVKFATGLVLAALVAEGVEEPLVLGIAKQVTPMVAGALYDMITKKIRGGAKVKKLKPLLRQLKKELSMLK